VVLRNNHRPHYLWVNSLNRKVLRQSHQRLQKAVAEPEKKLEDMAEARNSKTKRNGSPAVMIWLNHRFLIKFLLVLLLSALGFFAFFYYGLFVDFFH